MISLSRVLSELRESLLPLDSGMVASYIPELAKVDPNLFGISVAHVDGRVVSVGDSDARFTIQSVSKPFSYGIALESHGVAKVAERVGVEPTGDAFNSIMVEQATGRPYNPMVNAGAIAIADMLPGVDAEARLSRLLARFGRYVGRDDIEIDAATFQSERATGDRNRAIGHLMRALASAHETSREGSSAPSFVPREPPFARLDETLDLYFAQCSILVDCRDLAFMAATLAGGGVHPRTGQSAIAARHVKRVLSVLYSCGMYDSAGTWAFRVGLPAKSGVCGAILVVVPGVCGIAVYSPRIDSHGHSVRGVRVCEELSRQFHLHLFDSDRAAGCRRLTETF